MKNGEAVAVDEIKYINKANEYFNKYNINSTRHIFIASSDSRIFPSVVNLLTKDKYHAVQYVPPIPKSHEIRDDMGGRNVMEDILMDLFFISYSDYAVITYSSNIGRLVWELKSSIYPYEVSDNIHSMDIHTGFGWFGYQQTPWIITIRDNTQTKTFGDKTVMSYKRGERWILQSMKTLTIKNSSIVKVLEVTHRSKTHVRGLVFMNDTVEWRGIPEYINDYY